MSRKVIVALLIIFSLGTLFGYNVSYCLNSFGVEPQASSVYDPLIAEMISKINETEIYNSVYDLQNFTTRRYGTPGNVQADEYLFSELSKIPRLIVEYQGGNLSNIIATLNGTDTTSNAIYIVGAHYDSISSPDPNDAPGATDNGGGVAIVLELARIMSHYEFRHTLKFAFWNYEEGGLYGSSNYAWYAKNNNLNVSLYFNYDSSCYDPNNHFILDIMYNSQSQWVSTMIAELNTVYNINFALTYNNHTCSSDYAPFWWRGYTAVMTHEETHGPAHSQEDTIDKVSTSYAKKNGQIGMSVLAELAEVQGPWIPPDIEPPHISILSPTNKTYSSNSLPLTFTLNEPTSWITYSLDGNNNVAIGGNATLTDLSEGTHTIMVYANDTAGNVGQSDMIHFTVDTIHPGVTVLSPENKTYTTSSVALNFKVNRPTSWTGYSLDKQMNTSIVGNTTLVELSEGSHTIKVYANDTDGLMGRSDPVYFTIDTIPCEIEILSPQNTTYSTRSVPLDFTVDELTSWIAYSLDNKANATIAGNIMLSEIPDGPHNIIVYAKDVAGNAGASEMIHFTVNAQNTQKEEPFVPTYELYIGLTLAIVGAAVIGLALYMKRKPAKSSSSTSKHE